MKSSKLLGPILLFALVQVAWFALLGLWIYWYVANYITFTQIAERVYPQIVFSTKNVVALTGGIVLLVGASVGMSLIFERLRRQMKVTRMYDSFIANVTHELKSPLASIQLHLETLRERAIGPEKRGEFVHLMLKDAARLGNLITSILDISRLEERKSLLELRPHRADTLFKALVTEAADQFRAGSDSIEIRGEASCAVRADHGAMRIVIDNLINNAVKYSRGPAKIVVTLSHDKRRATVEVTDRGIGISAGDQKEVFKKFQRLAYAGSPSVKGTGLGLYWVREIVRHHRGRVSVSSLGPDRGSTFRIELPIEPTSGLARIMPLRLVRRNRERGPE